MTIPRLLVGGTITLALGMLPSAPLVHAAVPG